jgi:ABC-type antimicrobial peptide transport system permease subunit
MFKNSFKIAWRNLLRDRQFTLLNLAGLSIGLACTFLIYLWINHEVSMDNFQDDGLYEVMQNVSLGDKSLMTIGSTPDLLADALKDEVPGIADAATFKTPGYDEETCIISDGGGKSFKASEAFATENFFRMFSFKMLHGDPRKALANRAGILLSDRLAEKLFNSPDNAIGKTITWYKGLGKKINGTYVVSGVFAAPPSNSSRQFDVLFPHQRYMATTTQDINWNSSDPGTYITLKKGVTAGQINQRIKNFIRKKTGDTVWTGTLFLQRFKDGYLYNHYENGVPAGGRIAYVKLFSIVAVFLLVIACINFMNLSTAKASVRLKEVGIKKVVGAGRGLLIVQYLGESVLMALIAMVAAAAFVAVLVPYFESLTGADLMASFNPKILGVILLITLITGLLAGSYPALYLSGFKPALILKGTLNLPAGGTAIRKGLVVFQFCVSAILIISVLVVYRQMQFIQARDLGYNKENVISFKNEGNIQQNLHSFITEMRNIPGVVNVSDMEGDLFGNHSGGSGIDWPGKKGNIEFSGLYVDFNFLQTLGLQMKDGRPFSSAIPTDSTAVIFNETAIRQMGLTNPLGKAVKLWGSKNTIIGVVKDFHYESLYKNIGPLFISFRKNNQSIITRILPGAQRETIAKIASLYRKYNHGLPFEYKFFNEDYQALYAAEERVTVLSEWFAGIAILISCLGLFGLSAFIVQRRRKEISIRKVVGASASHLATLLSTDFLKLIFIAFLVAVPLSWLALERWLQTFAYHVTIDIQTFLVPGVAVILITIVTISFQTIKGAIANPVNSLRSE